MQRNQNINAIETSTIPTMLFLPCLLLLVAPLQVASQLPAALLELHRHEIVNAKERGAVCNDGSPGTSMHVQTAESRALPLGHTAP